MKALRRCVLVLAWLSAPTVLCLVTGRVVKSGHEIALYFAALNCSGWSWFLIDELGGE